MKYRRKRELVSAKPAAERLKRVRRYFGYRQDEMAALLGIAKDSYGKNERGVHLPVTDSLYAIHDKLGVNIEWLLFNRGAMFWRVDDSGKKAKGEIPAEILFASEADEMMSFMKRIPFLRYAVMGYYQKFRMENRELIDESLREEGGD